MVGPIRNYMLAGNKKEEAYERAIKDIKECSEKYLKEAQGKVENFTKSVEQIQSEIAQSKKDMEEVLIKSASKKLQAAYKKDPALQEFGKGSTQQRQGR